MLNIVGFSAKMGCGKTTITNHFIERMQYIHDWVTDKEHAKLHTWGTSDESPINLVFKRASFAGTLKADVASVLGIPEEWCYTEEGKQRIINTQNSAAADTEIPWPKPEMSLREILQWYGTDYWRAMDPDHWVKATILLCGASGHPNWVIDDVRFPNEADAILAAEGLVIRLKPYEGWVPNNEELANHLSETALDDYRKFTSEIAPRFGTLEEVASNIALDTTDYFCRMRKAKITAAKGFNTKDEPKSKILLC